MSSPAPPFSVQVRRPAELRSDWAGCGFDATGAMHCGGGDRRETVFYSLDDRKIAAATDPLAAAAYGGLRTTSVPAQTFTRATPEDMPLWYDGR
jgi:hypothetical protein